MNLMPIIANYLGLKIDEVFELVGMKSLYKLTEKGQLLVFDEGYTNEWIEASHSTFSEILSGRREIIKPPFNPTFDDIYYTFDEDRTVDCKRWIDSIYDLMRINTGLVFRTREEITEEVMTSTLEKLKGGFKNED